MTDVVAKKGRGYSTRYEDHVGLLRKLARGQWGIMQGLGIEVEFDDIFQEMSLAYCAALSGYNPEYGITFSAYLGRTALNNWAKVKDRLVRERMQLGMYSLDEIESGDEEGVASILDRIGGTCLSPEDEILQAESGREGLVTLLRNLKRRTGKSLSPLAARLVSDLMNPSDTIRAAWLARRSHSLRSRALDPESEEAKECGGISLIFIARLRGVPLPAFREVCSELNALTNSMAFNTRGYE